MTDTLKSGTCSQICFFRHSHITCHQSWNSWETQSYWHAERKKFGKLHILWTYPCLCCSLRRSKAFWRLPVTYSYGAVLGVPWCSEGCRGSCGVGALLHAGHWGQRRHQRRSAGVLKAAVRFDKFGSSFPVASIWKGLDFGLVVPVWLTTEVAQAVSPGWTQVEQPSLTSLSSHCYFPIPKCCLCPLAGLVVRVCSNLLTSCRETSWFFK